MKRALICSMLVAPLVLGACGKDGTDNNGNPNSSTSGTNNTTGGTNNGTTSSVPMVGDCGWGEFIATCGGGPERDLSSRAVGCTEYYDPTPVDIVSQDTLCMDQIWDEVEPCSDSGLSGRRPVGCCFEADLDTQLYSRHCFYDDPLSLESSGMKAQTACEDAGFCWLPAEMM